MGCSRSFPTVPLPSLLLFTLLVLVPSTTATNSRPPRPAPLFRPKATDNKVCINLGEWFQSKGPFKGELGLVHYPLREPEAFQSRGPIGGTGFQSIFRTQRKAFKIAFRLRVEPSSKYVVTTAHAEITRQNCREGARVLKVRVNRNVTTFDVYKKAGCRNAFFHTFDPVISRSNGIIYVSVSAKNNQPAILAGICVRRVNGTVGVPTPAPSASPRPRSSSPAPMPSTEPRPSTKPRPSKSSTPNPRPSRRPRPSQSSTPRRSRRPRPSQSSTPRRSRRPRPSQSSTPRRSRRPRPSQSSTPRRSRRPRPSQSSTPRPSRRPRPSQSSTPRPSPTVPFRPSGCQQPGCMNFEGRGDYTVIGASMSADEDREDCSIASSSTAGLQLPRGAVVKKALLYWSASGRMTKFASAVLNGVVVDASQTFFGGSGDYQFYGAEADVTHLITSSRGSSDDYTVSGVWYDNSGRLCEGNAAYAAWSMVVIYEDDSLPRARINACSDNFKFTYPAGTYNSVVECVDGNRWTTDARTTVVTFESDNYKGEEFYLNGGFVGDNLFRGVTAPNLDIRDFDILNEVRSGVSRIEYTIKSYFTYTRFGGAIEGLFMPVRVVYHTLE